MELIITFPDVNYSFNINVEQDITVDTLLQIISERIHISTNLITLFYLGRTLSPGKPLSQYQINNGNTIFAFSGPDTAFHVRSNSSGNLDGLLSMNRPNSNFSNGPSRNNLSFQEILDELNLMINKLSMTAADLQYYVSEENNELTNLNIQKLCAQAIFYHPHFMKNTNEITNRGISFDGSIPNPVNPQPPRIIASSGQGYAHEALPYDF